MTRSKRRKLDATARKRALEAGFRAAAEANFQGTPDEVAAMKAMSDIESLTSPLLTPEENAAFWESLEKAKQEAAIAAHTNLWAEEIAGEILTLPPAPSEPLTREDLLHRRSDQERFHTLLRAQQISDELNPPTEAELDSLNRYSRYHFGRPFMELVRECDAMTEHNVEAASELQNRPTVEENLRK